MSMRTHHQSGRSRIALVTALALLAQPLTPVMGQTPAPAAQAAAQKATPASAATEPPGCGRRAGASRPGLAACLPDAVRHRRSCSTSRRSSEWADQKHMVAYAAVGVEAPGRAEARARLGQDRGGHEGRARRSAWSASPTWRSPSRTSRRSARTRRGRSSPKSSRPSPRRTRHRARPRAGRRRQEPDPSEERRGREGRPAADLLQPDAGRARQHRRRADLEPDQGERPEVRRQHELGSLPARADQDVLPAGQRCVARRPPT